MTVRQRWADDRGSSVIAIAGLAPILLLLIGAIAVGARVALADDSITGVAAAAARDASLADNPVQAEQVATRTAAATLAAQDLHCRKTTINVDTSGFAAPPGTPASIHVTVTCVVSFADIALPGLPGSHTLTDSASSPLDPYRVTSLGFSNSDAPSAPNRTGGGA
jgi:hypothetical protein